MQMLEYSGDTPRSPLWLTLSFAKQGEWHTGIARRMRDMVHLKVIKRVEMLHVDSNKTFVAYLLTAKGKKFLYKERDLK
jgi:hypothetical protein